MADQNRWSGGAEQGGRDYDPRRGSGRDTDERDYRMQGREQGDWRARRGWGRDEERSFGGYGEGRGGQGSYGGGGYGQGGYGQRGYGEGGYPSDQRSMGGQYGGETYGEGAYGSYGRGGQDIGYGSGGAYRQGYGGQDVEQRQRGSRADEDDDRGMMGRAGERVRSWFDRSGEGQHRGRGPKGYTRSDERIREDVHDRLTDDPWIDASDVEVQVQSCEVTLTGAVASREDKRRAEDLVENVSGVRHVQNNLRMRAAATGSTQGAGEASRQAAAGGASSRTN